jgi:hypothetical protein
MKQKALITLLMAGTLTAGAADYKYLTIEKTDGTAASLTAIGLTIAYNGTQMTATNGEEEATFTLTEVSRMYFSDTKQTTGITAVETTIGTDAEVYDLNGRRQPQGTALRKGVYIVKENGKTRKITVK